MSKKRRKVLELSFLKGEGLGPKEPPSDGSISVADVIEELKAREGKIKRLSVTVEEDNTYYILHNTMTSKERAFLVMMTFNEILQCFYTYAGHPDNPEHR